MLNVCVVVGVVLCVDASNVALDMLSNVVVAVGDVMIAVVVELRCTLMMLLLHLRLLQSVLISIVAFGVMFIVFIIVFCEIGIVDRNVRYTCWCLLFLCVCLCVVGMCVIVGVCDVVVNVVVVVMLHCV